jgi:serine/threonine-protein kinase
MGEVYRARDTKLTRDVAIKVLPQAFAQDADRLARFTREAQTLASLNHSGIASIYGIEESASTGLRALVMELVEGDDLSAVIARGPVPFADAVPIARQIAEALEAAHEHGIIHRDLKPANVKVRADGTVKVLDFGLAKALAPDGSGASADAMNSPTLTARATQMGLIIGTAAYMAPEQAKGKPVDRRADIWAFGVVLYEMLSGRRAFEGEDVSETLAAVLTREPEFAAVPASTPPALVALMRRCLERDPKRRLRDIGEARLALEAPVADRPATATPPAAAAGASRQVTLWRVATAVLAATLLGVSVFSWRSTRTGAAAAPVRAAILLPRGVSLDLSLYTVVAISPDGSTVAVVGHSTGVRRLYVRRLGEFEPRLLEGTEDASSPFFSPDGSWIGFFAGGRLKKVPAAGGPVIALADAQDNRGGFWTQDDTIIYTPSAAVAVFRVPAASGTPTAVSTIDKTKRERTHRWPTVLPDGKTVLVTVGSVEHPDDYDDARIEAVRLDTGTRSVVIQGGRMARYASTGQLLFLRGKVLYAVAFDPARGTAGTSPVPVIDGVSGDVTTGAANYAIADSGAVVFVPGDPAGGERKMAWIDSKGAVTPIDAPTALYSDPHVSPDGRRVSLSVSVGSSTRDLHVIDTQRGTSSRLTFGGENRTALWSPDGTRLVYITVDRTRNVSTVMRTSADGTGAPEALGEIDGQAYAEDLTPDTGELVLSANPSTAGGRFSVFRMALQKGAKPVRVASAANGDVSMSALSPDRRWLAYTSSESGRNEIYVQSFASGGGRSQVSNAGGAEPRWAPDGRALYYAQADSLVRVPIEAGATFSPGKAQTLFGGLMPPVTDSGQTYAVSPKGERFLVLRPARENAGPPEVRLVLNWFDELRAIMIGK